MRDENVAVASVFNTLIGIVFVAIAVTVLWVTRGIPQFVIFPAMLALGFWWIIGGTRALQRYRMRALAGARRAINETDEKIASIRRARPETFLLDPVLARKIATGAWTAHHRVSVLGYVDGTVTLALPVLLGAGTVITLGWTALLFLIGGAIAVDFARSLLSSLGSRIGTALGLALVATYLYTRRGQLLPQNGPALQLSSLNVEQTLALATLIGIAAQTIFFLVQALTLYATSRRVVKIEGQFARELCASALVEALHLMIKPRAALRTDIRSEVSSAISDAISAASQLTDSLDGHLDPDARELASRHFLSFADFLRSVQLATATSSGEGWRKAETLLARNAEAVVRRDYGALDLHDFPEVAESSSRLARTLRRLPSLALAILPLAVVVTLPLLGVQIPSTLYGPILLAFAVYAVVGVLLVIDPAFRERTEATQNALSILTSAASTRSGDTNNPGPR